MNGEMAYPHALMHSTVVAYSRFLSCIVTAQPTASELATTFDVPGMPIANSVLSKL